MRQCVELNILLELYIKPGVLHSLMRADRMQRAGWPVNHRRVQGFGDSVHPVPPPRTHIVRAYRMNSYPTLHTDTSHYVLASTSL